MISNLKEFINYRTACPFCKSNLFVRGTIGISPSANVRLQKKGEKLIVLYTENDRFSQVINMVVNNIEINIIDNTIKYNKNKKDTFSYHEAPSLLGNRLRLIMKCRSKCINQYHLSSNLIYLDDMSKTTFQPQILLESFKYFVPGTDQNTVFNTNHVNQITNMTSYNENFKITHEETLPLVNFDFSDPEKMQKKIRMLLTFS